jgi:hypothetical protein
MRWLGRGGLLALAVALAVLIHHDSAGWAFSAQHQPQHTMSSGHHGGDHGDGRACGSSSTQVCTAASVDTVTVAPPVHHLVEYQPVPPRIRSFPSMGRSVARGPPDLSVLSVLRI